MLPIGYQIYQRRLERGLTQKAFAQKTGLPQPNLSNIEKGKQDVTITTLRRIAHALSVPIKEFFDDESNRSKLDLQLNRARIEKLARAIAKGDVALSREEKETVAFFYDILPGKKRNQVRIKKIHRSWLELKKRLGSQGIHILYERVQEVKRRRP